MKHLILASALGALVFFGCQEGNPVTQPNPDAAAPVQGQRVISELKVGDGAVTFYSNGKFLSFLEKRKPGAAPIISDDMNGLTFAEIYARLAPGQRVPEELSDVRDRYSVIPSHEIVAQDSSDGNHQDVEPVTPPFLAKTADLNDAWFHDNYCNKIWSAWSGYKACLLNRAGPGTDWAWANATRSAVYVYPHTGTFIHLNGKVDGSGIFDADLLTGWVYYYYMYSASKWYSFGCRTTLQHYYTITHTLNQFWHWTMGSHTDC